MDLRRLVFVKKKEIFVEKNKSLLHPISYFNIAI